MAGLSAREVQIVRLLAAAKSNKEIANTIGTTENTVKQQLHRIFEKLHMTSRVEVAVWAARFVVTLLLVTTIHAQTIISLKPGANVPGQVNLTVSLDSVAPGVSALQWRIALPLSWTAQQTIGSAGTGAAKQLYCTADFSSCLVAGLNTTAVTPGTLASVTLAVPPGNVNTSVSLQVSGLAGATASGASATVTAGAALTVALPTKCDANGDGKIDATDLAALALAILTDNQGAALDLNGDGKVDLLDVAPLANAAQTGVCK